MGDFFSGARGILVGLALTAVFIAGVLLLTGVFGPVSNQIDNNLFNSSPQHQQGVADQLTRDCTDLADATTDDSRNMIEAKIRQDAANVDVDTIPMDQAVRDCAHKAIRDGLNSH